MSEFIYLEFDSLPFEWLDEIEEEEIIEESDDL